MVPQGATNWPLKIPVVEKDRRPTTSGPNPGIVQHNPGSDADIKHMEPTLRERCERFLNPHLKYQRDRMVTFNNSHASRQSLHTGTGEPSSIYLFRPGSATDERCWRRILPRDVLICPMPGEGSLKSAGLWNNFWYMTWLLFLFILCIKVIDCYLTIYPRT